MAHSFGVRTNMLRRTGACTTSPFLQQPSRQCRPFSSTNSMRIKAPRMGTPDMASMPKTPPQMSMRNRMRDINPQEIPTDFGVLQGTFIKPEGKDMPSLFRQPKERLLFEWTWVKTWVTTVFQTIYALKWQIKPAQPLDLKGRRLIGTELHETMYTAFARGNERLIYEKCCPGLAEDLVKRIRRRLPDSSVTWSIIRYRRTPSTFFRGVRVLSDRAAVIPGIPDSFIRQVVVRIASDQTSMKVKKKDLSTATLADTSMMPRMESCTEYVVVQKVKISGYEKDWQIWGFAKPTTLEDLDSPFFSSQLSLKERLAAMQEMVSGRS